MTDDEKMLADFLARGGKVQKIETGASSNVTSGQWYKASQGVVDLRAKLANGPLPVKEKKKAKPRREGEAFYHDAYRRSN